MSRPSVLRGELSTVGQGSRGLARLGAAVCVLLTLGVAISRLFDDALPGQDHWASLNSRQGYMERTFPSDDYIGSGAVAEDARLWMPDDARYRVVVGEQIKAENSPWSWAAPNFLAGFLLPRKQTDSSTAPWVICLGCDRAALGPEFHVLSDAGNGVLFGRVGR